MYMTTSLPLSMPIIFNLLAVVSFFSNFLCIDLLCSLSSLFHVSLSPLHLILLSVALRCYHLHSTSSHSHCLPQGSPLHLQYALSASNVVASYIVIVSSHPPSPLLPPPSHLHLFYLFLSLLPILLFSFSSPLHSISLWSKWHQLVPRCPMQFHFHCQSKLPPGWDLKPWHQGSWITSHWRHNLWYEISFLFNISCLGL